MYLCTHIHTQYTHIIRIHTHVLAITFIEAGSMEHEVAVIFVVRLSVLRARGGAIGGGAEEGHLPALLVTRPTSCVLTTGSGCMVG